MILVYAFSNRWGTNVSSQTLLKLQALLPFSDKINFQKIYFHPRDFFRRYIDGSHYDLIIGLGDYYGPLSKIKIETQAKNVYSQQSIEPFYPIKIDLNLPNIDNLDSSSFIISSNAGTYNCNWIIYRIQLYLNHRSPSTCQLFFHLPPKTSASLLAADVYRLLSDNSLLS